MDKIVLIGQSFINPNYFNQRFLLKDEPDKHSMATVLEDVTGIKPKVLSLSGTGNGWVTDALMSTLPDIDKDTLVIISWAEFLRYDLYINPDKTNEELAPFLGMPKQSLMEKRIKKDPHFLRTFGPDGKQKNSGLRFWVTGSYNNFGIKKDLWENILSKPWICKDTLEKIIMVQGLLKAKGAKQIHFFADEPFDKDFKEYNKLLKEKHGDSESLEYKDIDASDYPMQPHMIFDVYPELEPWYDSVDWDLFTENTYMGYFQESGMPWFGGDNDINTHQPPINLYHFVCDELLNTPKEEAKIDEYTEYTKEFCTLYGFKYHF